MKIKPTSHNRFTLWCFLLLCISINSGCGTYYMKRLISTPAEVKKVNPDVPFLKAHLKDGSVALFTKWTIDEQNKHVSGQSVLRNTDRDIVKEGPDTITFDRISLFETNVINPSGASTSMSIISVGSAIVSVACIANPKACFGSCPTFYAWNGEEMSLMAEGFSSSILPSLEATDIDHLYGTKPTERRFELKVTNEALETHVIRTASLLAVPRSIDNQVFISPRDEFFSVGNITVPQSCTGRDGECVELLKRFDKHERFSLADSFDLAERETLTVTFDTVPHGKLGLVVSFRQTLLTTYLFYQTLAYLGNSASTLLAACERSDLKTYIGKPGQILGGIEVLMPDTKGNPINIGEFNETGPIATNIQILPLPDHLPFPETLFIRMAKGLWRLNHIALASIDTTVEPLRIVPSEVLRENKFDVEILEGLINKTKPLVTLPGDEYQIVYELPEDYDQYELFLESSGYYIEWLREEWLAEENIEKGLMMFTQPEKFLKSEAARYKDIEPYMEESFWGSRYVK